MSGAVATSGQDLPHQGDLAVIAERQAQIRAAVAASPMGRYRAGQEAARAQIEARVQLDEQEGRGAR